MGERQSYDPYHGPNIRAPISQEVIDHIAKDFADSIEAHEQREAESVLVEQRASAVTQPMLLPSEAPSVPSEILEEANRLAQSSDNYQDAEKAYYDAIVEHLVPRGQATPTPTPQPNLWTRFKQLFSLRGHGRHHS